MPQKIDSERLSQLAGRPVEITVQDGESLEQAEARVMQQNPDVFGQSQDDFGSDVSGPTSKAISLPQDVLAIKEYAGSLPLGSKEQEKALKMYEAARDDYLKLNPQSSGMKEFEQKEKNKQKTAIDIANLIKKLPEIETYPGIASGPAWAAQKVGAMIGLNPDLSDYDQKVSMLTVPVARGIMGDVGAVSDYAQKKAESYFPQGPTQLFSQKGRPRAIGNLIDSIQSQTGIDLTTLISPEELKAAAGPDPEGFIANILKNKNANPAAKNPSAPLQATHRFNPQTGQVERIR